MAAQPVLPLLDGDDEEASLAPPVYFVSNDELASYKVENKSFGLFKLSRRVTKPDGKYTYNK